jgi:hypothetical protein
MAQSGFLEALAVCTIALSTTRANDAVLDALRAGAQTVQTNDLVGAHHRQALAAIAGLTTIFYVCSGGTQTIMMANIAIQVCGALAALTIQREGDSARRA